MRVNKKQKSLYSSPIAKVFRLGPSLNVLANLSTDFVNVLDGEDEDQY